MDNQAGPESQTIPVVFNSQSMAVAFGMDGNTIRSEKLEGLAKTS